MVSAAEIRAVVPSAAVRASAERLDVVGAWLDAAACGENRENRARASRRARRRDGFVRLRVARRVRAVVGPRRVPRGGRRLRRRARRRIQRLQRFRARRCDGARGGFRATRAAARLARRRGRHRRGGGRRGDALRRRVFRIPIGGWFLRRRRVPAAPVRLLVLRDIGSFDGVRAGTRARRLRRAGDVRDPAARGTARRRRRRRRARARAGGRARGGDDAAARVAAAPTPWVLAHAPRRGGASGGVSVTVTVGGAVEGVRGRAVVPRASPGDENEDNKGLAAMKTSCAFGAVAPVARARRRRRPRAAT